MVQYTNAANPDNTDFYYSSSGQMKTDLRDMNMSGFDAWTGSGNYYSLAATDFTLLRGGSGYIKGDYVTWLGSQSTGALAAGNLYWVYIDSTGTLGTTSTFSTSLFTDSITLFEVLVDASSDVIVVKENHPYGFPTLSSVFNHNVIGTALGGAGAEITLSGTDEIQIVGADVLYDHGLNTTIPDSGGAAVNFSFMFTNGAGKWDRDSIGTNFLSEYNNAGAMTALSAGKYGVWRLYASKDDLNSTTPTYYAVAHTAEFNNLNLADTAIATGVAEATNELYDLELAQLGYVIYEESSSSIVQVIIEKDTLRGTTIGASNANQASLIVTDTTNFDNNLSSADTTVQAALETLDELSGGVYYPSIDFAFSGAYNISVSGTSPTQVTPTHERLYLGYFPVTIAKTFSLVGIMLTTVAAGSSARLGIYTLNRSTGALSLVEDYGVFSMAALGAITTAKTTSLTPDNVYLFAFVADTNGGTPKVVGMSNPDPMGLITGLTGFTSFYVNGVSAASALSASYALGSLTFSGATPPLMIYRC